MPAEPIPNAPPFPPHIRAARARGRRIAFTVYYLAAAGIGLAGAFQVSRQVLGGPTREAPYADCREGLRALIGAIDRARGAAPGTDGEGKAIDRFRSALEPEWSYRDAISSSCRGRTENEGALDAVERLRYAEEHAVRREAGDLAPLRRRVRSIDNELGSGPSRSTDPPPSAGDRR